MNYKNTKKSNSPGKAATDAVDSYIHGIKKVQTKVDKLPYERFPFCCTDPVIEKKEKDMTVKDIKILRVDKIPQTFWTKQIVDYYSRVRSTYREIYTPNGHLLTNVCS